MSNKPFTQALRRHPLAQAIGVATLALAGTTVSPAAMGQSMALEEIIVTAQRRMETLQDTPVAISALSEMELEKRGVNNIQDLLGNMPSMQGFQAPGSRANVSISIRGVSGGSPSNLSADPANAFYLDGVYIGKMVATALDVAELERIEVLRGPQGTLYGRNSTGGAINVITRKPTGEFGGRVTATVGNYNLRGVRGSLDLPAFGEVGEGLGRFAANFSYFQRERDELYGNTNPNADGFEDIDRRAWRFALNWRPSDRVNVDYAFDRSDLDELASLQTVTGFAPMTLFNDGTPYGMPISPGMAIGSMLGGPNAIPDPGHPTFARWQQEAQRTLQGLDRYEAMGKGRPSRGSSAEDNFTTNRSYGHNLTVEWDAGDLGVLGDVTFKSITGYREVRNRNFGDLSGIDGAEFINQNTIAALGQIYGNLNDPTLTPQEEAGLNFAAQRIWDLIDDPAYGGGYYRMDMRMQYEQRSQEFQMVGATDRVDYAIGLYYFEDEGSYANERFAAIPVGGLDYSAYENETKAWAVFGQATWRPPVLEDRLAVTAGLRYTEEKKTITYNYLFQNLLDPTQTSPQPRADAPFGSRYSDNFYNVSGMVNLAYQFTDDLNAYVTYSTGYRSGGFNGEVFNNPIDEETLSSWEVGVKSDWLNRRLRVNSALFHYTYKDMQISQILVDADGNTTSNIVNAGEAKRWGWELEVQAAPIQDLVLSASYTYIQGNFEEYASFCCDFNGNALPTDRLARRAQAPNNQFSISADYVFARTNYAVFTGYLSANWQSRSYSSALWTGDYSVQGHGNVVVPFEPIEWDERTLVNARLSIEDIRMGNGHLRVSLWGKNLTNDDHANFGINFASLGPITRQHGEPRTYGLDFTYEF